MYLHQFEVQVPPAQGDHPDLINYPPCPWSCTGPAFCKWGAPGIAGGGAKCSPDCSCIIAAAISCSSKFTSERSHKPSLRWAKEPGAI